MLTPLKALLEVDGWLAAELDRFWNVPVEGAVRFAACVPAFPVEGRVPTVPVEGRAPTLPVEGREPMAPVEACAPPELQPRTSRVLAVAVPEPLVRIRFESGCHFCTLFTFAVRELFTFTFRL